MISAKHLFLICSLLASMAGKVVAQSVEAEWRVSNMSDPVIVPPYGNGAVNPFPVLAEERAPVAEVVEMDPEALRSQQKSEILAEARKLIDGNNAAVARIDNLAFGGYVEGVQGKRILHRGQWLKEGARISVAIKGSNNVYQLLERLKEFDIELAEGMMKEFDARMAQGKTELTIVTIGKDKVVLREGKQTYEVPWNASDL